MTLIRRKISGPQLLLELFRQCCSHAVAEHDNAAAIFLYIKRKNGEQLWVVIERFVSNENKAILEGYTPDEQTKRVVLKRCLSKEEWKKFSTEASKDTNKSIQDLMFADVKPFIDRQYEAEKSVENLRQQAPACPADDGKEKSKKAEQGKRGGKGKGKGRGKKQQQQHDGEKEKKSEKSKKSSEDGGSGKKAGEQQSKPKCYVCDSEEHMIGECPFKAKLKELISKEKSASARPKGKDAKSKKVSPPRKSPPRKSGSVSSLGDSDLPDMVSSDEFEAEWDALKRLIRH
uniref:CCHC-type domain-containing protein n=1 Tax=Chromera velia CCMP2878 TaxID=1169474 RepID=A0A0G4G7F8_9ALVE|eukprot:Cvel_4266.t1-p1 / transcript=Cvel_4266.t1 / gene=Cvel_4266 / organism=Chromera_velia_CCMP2878 / gene_product=hypothetical protein / transcript_product=hypothetical protein / location=Cvel_scaffold185:8973-9833(-) / protein_length=287 / sequence_SO=supercontig / SO=protein_coding / is_pseudo=false